MRNWTIVSSILRYHQYHRPIDSPVRLGSNRSVGADSFGRATLKKTALAAPLACQEENDEYYRQGARSKSQLCKKLQSNTQEASGPQDRSCNLYGSSSLRPLSDFESAPSRYRRYPNR